MKKLEVAESLLDKEMHLNTWQYCAPIFITSSTGILLGGDQNLLPSNYKKGVRNGTVTFVSFKDGLFALTCAHVNDLLKNNRLKHKSNFLKKFKTCPDDEIIHFFSPRGEAQYHFCYNFTNVNINNGDTKPDIAIARIDSFVMERLEREPIRLDEAMPDLPVTGIASGYPEEQRSSYTSSKFLNTFSPKFIACVATMQLTANCDLFIQDQIEHHNNVNVLSGMSGGPIIWSKGDSFGLAGLAREASNLQPQHEGIFNCNNIFIQGVRITPQLFDSWLASIPAKQQLKDRSAKLIIPSGMK